jgi:drug/metabolite transporter (DMT)-like permease
MAFTAARFVVASLLISPALRGVSRAEWRAGSILGCLLALAFCAQTVGLQWTSASRSGFLTSLYIPLTPLIVLAVYRTLPERSATAGLILAVTGMFLLTGYGGFGGGLNRGDGLTLLSALTFAAHMVATGVFARQYRVERLMMAQVVVGAMLSTLATPLLETPRLTWTPLLVGMVAYEAVLASIVALQLQLAAQQVVSATYAALVYSLEPVVALGASLVLTGDRLSPMQSIGGFLIVIGSFLPELRRATFTRS